MKTSRGCDHQFWRLEKAHIYAITCDRFVKIGMTTSPLSRIPVYRTHNPMDMEIAFHRSVPKEYARRIERRIHQLLDEKIYRGEWFTASVDEAKAAFAQARKEAIEHAKAETERIRAKYQRPVEDRMRYRSCPATSAGRAG